MRSMIHSRDPSRLFESEDTPRELREWLTDARKHKPSAVQVQHLVQAVNCLQGLEPSGLQLLGHAPAPEAYAAGAGKALIATKLVATVAIGLATAGVGIYFWQGLSSQPGGAHLFEQPPASGSKLDSMERVKPARNPIAEPAPLEGAPQERTSPIVERTPQESAAQERVSPATSPLAPTHHARRRHAAENHRSTPTIQTSDATVESERERAGESASQADAKAPPVATDSQPQSAEEWRTLRAARQAVSTDPARALALVQEHAQKFPHGMLCQEREAIAIDALARLGRTGEAQERATAFAGRFPASPYRRRNEVSLSRSVKSGSKP